MIIFLQVILISLILAIPVSIFLKIVFKKLDNELDFLASYIYALAGVFVIVGFIYVIVEIVRK